ncbi:hypothetical protein GUJ93_ZPchr0039g14209 [Zizania palustris]|uniref:Uncharacterized protein n=1 Tax=Zizania palustris TaxID=103762 RepID=A0A8J5RGJ5_ZIZPA|nr:hypothetical protein GUJ93_ZPchr0039g14209 [Zizania palustris]
MKGQAGGAAPSKRRWRSVAAASAAMALLFFSVGVPLAVLLGLHGRFPSSPYPAKTLPFLLSPSLPAPRSGLLFRVFGRGERSVGECHEID